MKHIFEVTDKTGRKIRLTETQYTHILQHKGMEQHLGNIQQTLIKPTKIVNREEGSVADYYSHFKHRKSQYKILQVVVMDNSDDCNTFF